MPPQSLCFFHKKEKIAHPKIAHFSYIDLLDNKPDGIVELAIPNTEKPPELFGFESICPTTLAMGIIPSELQTEFYCYTTHKIKDWDNLECLFDTLKSNDYKVLYTFSGARREVQKFTEFKNAIISEYQYTQNRNLDKATHTIETTLNHTPEPILACRTLNKMT